MKAKDLDKIFDERVVGITDFLDLSKAFRPGLKRKRVNVDFPIWMIDRQEKESSRPGVPRQSLIKVWIAEKLETRRGKRRIQSTQVEFAADLQPGLLRWAAFCARVGWRPGNAFNRVAWSRQRSAGESSISEPIHTSIPLAFASPKRALK